MKMVPVILLAAVSGGAGAWGWRRQGAVRQGGAGSVPQRALSAMEQALAGLPAGPLADWVRRIAGAGAADFSTLLAAVETLPDGPEKTDAIRLLLARWAEVDPEAAWTASEDLGERGRVLAVWLQGDFAGAMAALDGLDVDAGELLEDASEFLLDQSPDTLWRVAMTRRCLPVFSEDARWAALVRAHEAEAAALAREWIAMHREGEADEPAWGTLKIVHRARAERDPHAALAWVKTLPAEERKMAFCDVLPFLARVDPEAAAGEFLTMRAMGSGPGGAVADVSQTMSDIAREMGRRDPAKALEWLRRVAVPNGEATGPAGKVLATAIRDGRLSPEQAFAMVCPVAADPDAGWSMVPIQMWRGLPASTLAEAAEWLKGRTNGGNATMAALKGVMAEWARIDRKEALAFAEGLPTEAQVPLYREMLYPPAWDLDDPEMQGGSPRLEELPLQGGFDRVPRAARAGLIEADLEIQGDNLAPVQGFDGWPYARALDEIGDPAGIRDAAVRLGKLWGRFDPVAAMAWARQQANGDTQRAAVEATMEGWVTADSWGASTWLATQPPGADRDGAAEQLAASIREEEPDSAWKWAVSIANPEARSRTMQAVLESWAGADADQARNALENTGSLDEATRSQLRSAFFHEEPPTRPQK